MCPDSTLQTLLPQRSSSSAREEEDRWGLDGRQAKAKDCLREPSQGHAEIFDKSDDVKVGITELRERVEVPLQFGISIQHVAQLARSENGQKIFEVFWQEEELCTASWARWDAHRKGLVDLERRCQDTSWEIQMLNKRQEIFQNAIGGGHRVQDRAGE